MASLYNADLKSLAPGVGTHPYTHASKLFLADNFRLAPKQSFLYYVCINIDKDTLQNILITTQSINTSVSSQTLLEQYEAGLMAKRVDLPKFNIGSKTLNSYNRKNIVQTNISYDPITISFHDDAADIVTNFWNDYYTYYYRDSDYDATLYQTPHKYNPRLRSNWGFNPRNSSATPFLRNIQIFSLHNKRFTEYLLINPYITGWRHGEHNSSGGGDTLENTMTVAFETVKYKTGYVNPVDVNGFAVLHYDNFDSPISTSVTNIYSDSGIVGALADGAKDLARPPGTGSGRGVFGSVLDAYRLYNGAKNANFGTLIGTTIGQIGGRIINGAVNSTYTNSSFFPTLSGIPGYSDAATSQIKTNTGLISYESPYANPPNGDGVSISGSASAITVGSAINYVRGAFDNWTRGTISNQAGAAGNPNSTTVYQATDNSGEIAIAARTGQPVTGQQTALLLDSSGTVVSNYATTGAQAGSFNPNNVNENLKVTQTFTDSSGQTILQKTYNDGTRVIFNSSGEILQTYPGAKTNATNIDTNPTNTRDIIAAGGSVNPNAPQYFTNPVTGLTYSVGNTSSAYITNALSGVAGITGGLYAGTTLNTVLNSTALGRSVIGQGVSAAVSGLSGAVIGRAINNGIQPLTNGITGSIVQGWDSVSGSIKNIVGTWTGNGGQVANNPTQNVVSQVENQYGGKTTVFKNGSVISTNADDEVVSTTEGIYEPTFTNWTPAVLGENSDVYASLPNSGTLASDVSNNTVWPFTDGDITIG